MTKEEALDAVIGATLKVLESNTLTFEERATMEFNLRELLEMISDQLTGEEVEKQVVIDADGNRTVSLKAIQDAVLRRWKGEYPRGVEALDLGIGEKQS